MAVLLTHTDEIITRTHTRVWSRLQLKVGEFVTSDDSNGVRGVG
jgi:hypothetical protein